MSLYRALRSASSILTRSAAEKRASERILRGSVSASPIFFKAKAAPLATEKTASKPCRVSFNASMRAGTADTSPIFPNAEAIGRTSRRVSCIAAMRAGTADTSTISPKATAALKQTSLLVSCSASMRAGTAAVSAILPNAPAARERTFLSYPSISGGGQEQQKKHLCILTRKERSKKRFRVYPSIPR